MTFSLRPRNSSRLPMMAASVSTRVVSWNEAAEMNESVDSEALVIPSSTILIVGAALVLLHHLVVLVQHLGALHLLLADEVRVTRIGR